MANESEITSVDEMRGDELEMISNNQLLAESRRVILSRRLLEQFKNMPFPKENETW